MLVAWHLGSSQEEGWIGGCILRLVLINCCNIQDRKSLKNDKHLNLVRLIDTKQASDSWQRVIRGTVLNQVRD